MSDEHRSIERATLATGGRHTTETTLRVDGKSVTVRTTLSPIEIVEFVRSRGAGKRAEDKMRARGLL